MNHTRCVFSILKIPRQQLSFEIRLSTDWYKREEANMTLLLSFYLKFMSLAKSTKTKQNLFAFLFKRSLSLNFPVLGLH